MIAASRKLLDFVEMESWESELRYQEEIAGPSTSSIQIF
jgi:hypothetical protein